MYTYCIVTILCTKFDRNPKPTATPIFRPQQNQESHFLLRGTLQNGTLGV